MKGQEKISNTIIIVAMAAVALFFISNFMNFMMDVQKLFALASAEVVSRDLAGLISVSGSEPEEITIFYGGISEEVSYDIKLENRKIEVKMLDEEKEVIGGPIEEGYAVDPPPRTIYDKRYFIIGKREDKYFFEGYK